jgi:glucose-6-phosphate isomerase
MSDALPLVAELEGATGVMRPGREVLARHLSDMTETYEDQAAVAAVLANGEDPLIYEAYEPEGDPPGAPGELVFRTTVIHPGTIGDEYFMTYGHDHVRASGEVYLGLAGHGQIIMQKPDGRAQTAALSPGSCVNVPVGWSHRTMNDADEPFVFLAVFLADAGHDYAWVPAHGFVARLNRGPNGPQWSPPLPVAGPGAVI